MMYTVYGESVGMYDGKRNFENKTDAYKCYRDFVKSDEFVYCELTENGKVLVSCELWEK